MMMISVMKKPFSKIVTLVITRIVELILRELAEWFAITQAISQALALYRIINRFMSSVALDPKKEYMNPLQSPILLRKSERKIKYWTTGGVDNCVDAVSLS